MKMFLGLLLVPTLALAATERQVSSTGLCTRAVTPDRGSLTMTAEFTEKDLKSAAAKASQSYERVRAAVAALKLKDFESASSEYSLQEAREWVKDKHISRGFRARLGLRVTTSEIQRLGEVIAIASNEGLRDVGALQVFLSPSKHKTEYSACLQEAAEHARAKAEKLATSLGARLGNPVSLSESENSGGAQPIFRNALMKTEMSGDSAAGAPGIEAGAQQLSVTVSAIFELR